MSDLVPTKAEVVAHLAADGRVEEMVLDRWCRVQSDAVQWEAGHSGLNDDTRLVRFRLIR